MRGFKYGNFDLIKDIVVNHPINLMVDFGIRDIEEYNAIKEKIVKTNAKIDLIVEAETYLNDQFPNEGIIRGRLAKMDVIRLKVRD